MTEASDPLWHHFKPLWLDFAKVGDGVLVAGGYGLFLKQQWLLDNDTQPIVIPVENWPDTAPRATNDMDLVVALDLISDETANRVGERNVGRQVASRRSRHHPRRPPFLV